MNRENEPLRLIRPEQPSTLDAFKNFNAGARADLLATDEAQDVSLQARYMLQYPNYCRVCSGYGQFAGTNKVDFGGGSMVDAEPCNACTSKGLCPRCGKEGLTNQEVGRGNDVGAGPCTFCSWDYSDGGIPVLPYDGYYGDEEEERYYDNNGMSDNQIAMEERFYEEMRLQREAERYEEIEVFEGVFSTFRVIEGVVTIESAWSVDVYYDESLKRWNTSHPF